MSDIKPFKIAVPDDALQQLQQRLSTTSFPSQLQGPDNYALGSTVEDMKRLTEYWKNGFDWRKAEASLNELPQFRTAVGVAGFGDIDVHFVHQVSPVKGAIPLLFSHGWPGSFIEVKKLLPLLEGGDGRPAFHIVAPSLPNFGFSSGVNTKGFGLKQYAETFHKLMLKLGYNEYVTQGGDWGFWVTRSIGLLYPEHCKASHINLILAIQPTFSENPVAAVQHAITPYNKRERDGVERNKWFNEQGFGYNLLQSTKPQTIGFALADSPIAVLAWIYEKLHEWTDSYPWTDDEILTWISIYWFSTAGPAASVRIYHEATHPDPVSGLKYQNLQKYIPGVKLGLAHFPREINIVPKTWGATLGPVCYQSEHERGGHFAAWEMPEAIAGDLQKMFGKGGPCFGVVAGKSGY